MAGMSGRLNELTRLEVMVTGVVQGVGFRPFVYREAVSRNLCGSVINTSAGVSIDVEGPAGAIDDFLEAVRRGAPPNSLITGMDLSTRTPVGFASFEIGASMASAGGRQLVSPDSCTCGDCLAELFDHGDRRFRYPFINCTNCGPRFTIIEGLPYDRPLTTMKKFTMCPECLAEYEDPGSRRFHAEPNACPECGPRLWLAGASGERASVDDPIAAAAARLLDGDIVAIKGLGGFQLACLAADDAAVARLRTRKARPDKPFAVMVASAAEADRYCRISAEERRLLESSQRPIVLLKRRVLSKPREGISGTAADAVAVRLEVRDEDGGIYAVAPRGEADPRDTGNGICDAVAPRLGHLGVMLPCAPLHFLLMEAVGAPLVMTSGNLSNEPICRANDEALGRLAGIADFFLLHDRGIRSAYDDSVVMVANGAPVMIRRARGYAPLPVGLPGGDPSGIQVAGRDAAVLAAGAQLKNTFCLAQSGQAFVSQHIGDLEDAETLKHYEQTISMYEELFSARPSRFVCDSHPEYLSSSYVLERNQAPLKVQHHEAHAASCLAENGFTGKAVAVTLDGAGLGDDGRIWGGEFFTGSLLRGFDRAAHLEYMPLPGGDAAVREPWRMALGAVWRFAPEKVDLVAELLEIPGQQKNILLKQLWAGINTPQTSSCGRLFDAVAAMVLGRKTVSYEAQAAMELEALAAGAGAPEVDATGERGYDFIVDRQGEPWKISPAEVIRSLIIDLEGGIAPAVIARRFHIFMARAIVEIVTELADRHQLDTAALSGGVFQNRTLLEVTTAGLAGGGLQVLLHRDLPPNDGGISYGQAAIAFYNSPPSVGGV